MASIKNVVFGFLFFVASISVAYGSARISSRDDIQLSALGEARPAPRFLQASESWSAPDVGFPSMSNQLQVGPSGIAQQSNLGVGGKYLPYYPSYYPEPVAPVYSHLPVYEHLRPAVVPSYDYIPPSAANSVTSLQSNPYMGANYENSKKVQTSFQHSAEENSSGAVAQGNPLNYYKDDAYVQPGVAYPNVVPAPAYAPAYAAYGAPVGRGYLPS